MVRHLTCLMKLYLLIFLFRLEKQRLKEQVSRCISVHSAQLCDWLFSILKASPYSPKPDAHALPKEFIALAKVVCHSD